RSVDDIDLFEHNEAYAAASLAVMRELGIPHEKLNVNGGAVALGHPIGCSGARVLTTLAYAMKDRGAKRGLATLCLGGGNAVSMIIEHPGRRSRPWAVEFACSARSIPKDMLVYIVRHGESEAPTKGKGHATEE